MTIPTINRLKNIYKNIKNRENLPPRIKEIIDKKILASSITPGSIIECSFVYFPLEGNQPSQPTLKRVTFKKCIFSHQLIANSIFQDCQFIDCIFNGARITEVEFHQCFFSECAFYKTKISSTYLDPTSFKFSWKWHWNWANINASLFQTLYRNSKNMHQEEFAMNSDKKFQFYRRYDYLRGKNRHPNKFLRGLLFDYLLGYGYGIKNSLYVTAGLILGYSYLIDGTFKEKELSILQSVYFSVVSFTTVGYGDMTPKYDIIPMAITITFLLISVAWCAVVTAIIVKRIVK
ncbi:MULTISPECIES: ion channel [unclassified Pseudomonas]|uniref:ion channel n=1 Tax=unclassified Pseudomonas TaxID=196821 RepID=UPI0014743337|nr:MULTISPECIES: ion channel [unclassified Pseudomonas]NMY38220.1 potassium ABC transporter [Pseudomonas sp. WS 5078]NMY61136.1 potassium ABC transporter [Pseudomonas sp. WS 5354]